MQRLWSVWKIYKVKVLHVNILFNKSKFSRKSLKFSKPTFWAILIEPIFPDLINISSAVRLDGISKSYSEIDLPAHFIFFGKFSELISSEKNGDYLLT